MSARTSEYVEGMSAKYWRITLDGSSHTVSYGRIGTQGQAQTEAFGDQAAAAASYRKLIDEKLRTGYVEVGATVASARGHPPSVVGAMVPT